MLRDMASVFFNFNGLFKSKKARRQNVCANERDTIDRICSYEHFYERLALFDIQELFPLSVVICDVNGLPLINDTLGRPEAGRLIALAEKLISDFVRREDIVARTGEERFSILLPRTSGKEACLIIDRILGACADKREACEDGLCISISAGCATKQHINENIHSILRAAEYDLNVQKQSEQKSFYNSLLKSIKKALYEKSHETEEHGERLVYQSRLLGEALGLPDDQLVRLEVLAMLHDIGKVCIEASILTKPGALDEDEWEQIKKHPESGCRIAMAVPQLRVIAQDILSHHERWDGAGYPSRLCGESIPLLSRIVSVVDAFDALTSKRCYKEPVSAEEALLEIERNAGTQFDPIIASVFIELKRNEIAPQRSKAR